jgi:nucleoside-diphosphate-sugar epimerase
LNGSLGRDVIPGLVNEGFDVTGVTQDRTRSLARFAESASLKIVQAEYTVNGLAEVLRGHDAVLCLISRVQPEAQNMVADAAVAAGVYRFIPSYFGIDMRVPELRENPALLPKVAIQDHLEALVAQGKITYTGLSTGALFDWAMRGGFLMNLKTGESTMVFDGGDIPVTISTHSDVVKAIATVLRKPAETENKYLLLQSAVVTQNQLLKLAAEACPERVLKRIDVDSKGPIEKSKERYANGERSPDAVRGYLLGVLVKGYHCFKYTDNELLGIKQWDEAMLRARLVQIATELDGT